MKKFYSFLGALLVATGLFAQTNYTCTFLANVPMDSVQVKNTVSGEAKMLYYPDNVITLQKVEKQDVAIATVANSAFLQQTANNIVAVNVETASLLNLTLYSANGTVVARYANAVSAGQYIFQVGASAGVYVLVASANDQTASLKLSLQGNAQAGIFEVAATEPVAFLKAADDVIAFNEGETFEFTGYYKKQTDVKTAVITESEEIVFAFERDYEGAIKFAFSVSDDKQVYFSKGNLQYQGLSETWRFAENQYDVIGKDNYYISIAYTGWIDLFGWGTSGWYTGYATAFQPYQSDNDAANYFSLDNLTGDFANADWGVYNAISNGGNHVGLWRTLTKNEWEYLLNKRTDAQNKSGQATIDGISGIILLPDNWTLPNGLTFTSGANENTYSTADWTKMEANGAVFLPPAGFRNGTKVKNVGSTGYYWSSTRNNVEINSSYGIVYETTDSKVSTVVVSRNNGISVRLVQDVE